MTETFAKDAALPKAHQPYTTPALKVFGSLGDLTRLIGTTGNADGGGKGMNRSKP